MVAMAIMVASLRGSFATWLERLLPADVYVQAGGAGQSTLLDDESIRALRNLDFVARAERSRSLDVLLPGDRTAVTLIARSMADAAQMYVIDRETNRVPPSGAVPVFVSVALADRLNLAPSDRLPFTVGGHEITGYVRGIVRDYGNASGTILIDSTDYEARTGDRSTTSMSLWLKPDVKLESAIADVRARVPNTVGVRAQRDIRERSLAIFDRTFAVTYLLEAVAVLIGMFGISVSASAQVLARRAEFGVLRHLGFSRRQIGTLLTIDGLCLGTLGVVAGIAMGVLISGILIYVVSRQSFHWTMDLHLPIAGLVSLAIAVPCAAALTARWSGRAALSEDVVRAVKEDW
jgi:putative ABC transport system permease protein